MQNASLKKVLIIGVFLFLLNPNIFSIKGESLKNESYMFNSVQNRHQYNIEIYKVKTEDRSLVTLARYVGNKRPSIMLIHGMGCNHKIFDWDENHSLARYLARDGWDVWLLDLRTHDGDGDYFFVPGSDREYINRYWDFDNTYLKIDVVTAVDFIKQQTNAYKIVLGGHSYGGYLAYAYAMLLGEKNLSGIITTGASPYAMPEDVYKNFTSPYPLISLSIYGFFIGKKAIVNPIGMPWSHTSKFRCDNYYKNWTPIANAIFYYNTTAEYIQKNIIYTGDDEPAGVCVDMFFGKHPTWYRGHWVDPQTLYDYTTNLNKITVPILFISGDNDLQDPCIDIYRGYENVSSTDKAFYSFPHHSHLDLLLGDDASDLIFPHITTWLSILNTSHE